MGKRVQICGFCGKEKVIVGRGLCAACYQRHWKNGTPEYVKIRHVCKIDDCDNLSVAQGLCDMHYRRWKRHGDTKQTRPKGWGSKEKHPLYQIWCRLKRRDVALVLCVEWQEFWQFVEDVGEKPSKDHRFCIIDRSRLIDKDNYEWQIWEKGGGDRERRTAYCKQWRKDNSEKVKNASLKKQFGITLDIYYDLLESQNYVCAICGEGEVTINPRTKKAFDLAVDHCHQTKKVRGLLCKSCNNMLGHAKDSPKLLTKAINYLKQHNK